MVFIDNSISMTSSLEAQKIALLERVEKILAHSISFTHEWDMERCAKEYVFNGDWDVSPNNDPEWVWMLNRCRFIEELGCAYHITKDIRYAQGVETYIRHWIEHNTTKNEKTTWRSIDTGIRAVSWLKALDYVHDIVSPEFLDVVRVSLLEHSDYLYNGLSNTSYTSNWGVMEAHGLFAISIAYDLPYKAAALDVLYKTAQYQILSDGVQWERSPMYHNEVLHCYLETIYLAQKHSIELDELLINKTYRMLEANLAWQKPNGNQPLWGDSDDTSLVQLLSLGGVILNQGVFKQAQYLDLEYHFMLSPQYEKLTATPTPITSTYLDSSGFLILKTPTTYLNFITKNFGGGHSHGDLLHVGFFANNKEYLIDGGRCTYVEGNEREFLKSQYAHNSILINGKQNTVYKDSWSTSREAIPVEGQWHHSNQIDWAYAHDLSHLQEQVFITRNIIHFQEQGFLVLDSVQCTKETEIQLLFNSPKTIEVHSNHVSFEELSLHHHAPTISVRDSFYSLHYNEKTTSQQLTQTYTTDKNILIANLFTFESSSSIIEIPLLDRKGRPIANDKAKGYDITLGDKHYTLLYKIEPSAENSGFFIESNQHFYLNRHVLLCGDTEIFNF